VATGDRAITAMPVVQGNSMKTHSLCHALLVACLLAGCGGASDDYEPPHLPPPPAPPPAPTVEEAPLPEPYTQATPNVPAASALPQPPAPPPAPPASVAPAPPSPPAASLAVSQAPPPPVVYSSGQWVYLSGQGWVWIPAEATTTDMEGVPYVQLYTPAYGWTWYVSPWGWGRYRYGIWVRHPWHPVGVHGYWVARPHVVVRLGHRRR
jgi:hypothetical protein